METFLYTEWEEKELVLSYTNQKKSLLTGFQLEKERTRDIKENRKNIELDSKFSK